MKSFFLSLLLFSSLVMADTPPPGTVRSKTYSGDGVTAITATGGALNVNVSNTSGLTTVNQGNAGIESWLASVTSSALPTNACQETGGHLASIDTKLTAPLAVSGTFWQATQPVSGTFFQSVQPVSLPSPLPSGTNTIGAVNINGTVPISGTVTATNSANGPIASPVPLQATQVGGVDGSGDLRALKVSSTGVLSVDGSAVTQPVSGTFYQATQPVSASSLPLPTGASTEATQLDVKTNTGNTATSVSSIDSKTPTLGQALAAGSVPVVLPAAQISTLTPLSTITANAGTGTFLVDGSAHTQPVSGTFWQATQPVSGTVTANAGTGTFTVDGSGHTQPVSGTVTANIGTTNGLALDATVSGLQVSQGSTTSGEKGGLSLGAVTTSAPTYTTAQSNPLSLTTAGALRVDGSAVTQPVSGTFWQTTQPVSGTVTANAGSGTFTVSGTVTANAGSGTLLVDGSAHTQPVSLASPVPAGTNVIGHVIVDTAPTTAVTQSGTWTVNSKAQTPTAATVKQAAVTVGTSAVRLTNDGLAPPSTRTLLVAQLLSTSTANCFFGSSGVTSSGSTRGVQMFAGQTLSFSYDAGDYYAICDASAQTVFITEQE